MKQKEKYFSLFLLALSLFYLFKSLKIPLGTVREPGPGFLPIILGLVAVGTCCLLLFPLCKKGNDQEKQEEQKSSNQHNNIKVLAYVAMLIVFALLFKIVGTIVAVFFLTLSLAKFSGLGGWRKPLILSICFSVAVYTVFATWLKVPLPGLPQWF